MEEIVGGEPSHNEVPAPIVEANLALPIGEVPQEVEPQADLDQRKLGLSIVRNFGWSGSNYDDYE